MTIRTIFVSASVLAVLVLLPLAACVTSANRCLPGFEYVPAHEACVAPDSGADASPDAQAAAPDASDPGDAGLGTRCNADTDCTGDASYCLKNPNAPATDPGICTFVGCTPADCTSAYGCCDCSAASLDGLKTWPVGVCVPTDTKANLALAGCTCS